MLFAGSSSSQPFLNEKVVKGAKPGAKRGQTLTVLSKPIS